MATKRTPTKPAAVRPIAAKSTGARSTAVKPAAAKSSAVKSTATDSTAPAKPTASRPGLFSRSVTLPAAGIGLVTLILAMQENASFPIALVVGVAVTFVVIGMIALKRAFYGD